MTTPNLTEINNLILQIEKLGGEFCSDEIVALLSNPMTQTKALELLQTADPEKIYDLLSSFIPEKTSILASIFESFLKRSDANEVIPHTSEWLLNLEEISPELFLLIINNNWENYALYRFAFESKNEDLKNWAEKELEKIEERHTEEDKNKKIASKDLICKLTKSDITNALKSSSDNDLSEFLGLLNAESNKFDEFKDIIIEELLKGRDSKIRSLLHTLSIIDSSDPKRQKLWDKILKRRLFGIFPIYNSYSIYFVSKNARESYIAVGAIKSEQECNTFLNDIKNVGYYQFTESCKNILKNSNLAPVRFVVINMLISQFGISNFSREYYSDVHPEDKVVLASKYNECKVRYLKENLMNLVSIKTEDFSTSN